MASEDRLTAAVDCSDWRQVVRIVHTDHRTDHQRCWAVEETAKRAPEKFVAEILGDCPADELCAALPHVLRRRLWRCVVRVMLRNAGHAGGDLNAEQTVSGKSNEECVWWLLLLCFEDVLEQLLQLLVEHNLWQHVGEILQLKIKRSQHIWAVQTAMHYFADPDDFVKYILPHCWDEELEQVLTYLVLRREWKYVGSLLERGFGSSQRRKIIEEASKRATEEDFCDNILHHCADEDLGQVLEHMVTRDVWEPAATAADTDSIKEHIMSQLVAHHLWGAVGRFLQQGISRSQHTWVMEEASKHVWPHYFVDVFLPQCFPAELEGVLTHLVSGKQWRSVDKVLERGVSQEGHRWAVEEALNHADEESFATSMLNHCADEQLERVFSHMLLRGFWKSAESVTPSDDDIMHQILSNLISHGLWEAVGRFLQRSIIPSQHAWAVEESGRHAEDFDFAYYILPQCSTEELERAVAPLVLRAQWEAVGEVLAVGIRTELQRWVVEEACQRASDEDLVAHILPHCGDEDLDEGLTHIVSWGLMRSVGIVLERGINHSMYKWIFEETAQKSREEDFINYILPVCCGVEEEHVTACLVSQGMWASLDKVLEQGVSRTQLVWVVREAAQHAGDLEFLSYIQSHCTEDDIVSLIPVLLATQKWTSVSSVLKTAVCDALYTWVTLKQDSATQDRLFWKLAHDCHVQQWAAQDLRKVVMKDVVDLSSCRLASRLSWENPLCEVMVTSLSLTLCHVMCAEERERTAVRLRPKLCMSSTFTSISDCMKENVSSIWDNELTTIKNKEKWISVFSEMADGYKADPLSSLSFLQSLNLYHSRSQARSFAWLSEPAYIFRLRECDDDILFVILAVLPLFPGLQSAALGILLRQKRWDVISQACLSHVWEHDRRQLFKAAVEQRQWNVVRQWADHSLHDDQRDWAMTEAFREKQWQVYLLLADHGLTMQEQMHAHYILAKYGDWNTVLQMVERGMDITEVSSLLENWVTGNLRKKPHGDVTIYFERCKKLIRLMLRFVRNSTLSPSKVLRNGMWGSVLFSILHDPTEEYFSQVLHKVMDEQEWHILMHLVRLGMTRGERDWLFPQMVRQQQWGVCRKLLEIGVDVHLCLEALPELLEKNQWTLVARVMEYGVDDAVRYQVMQCAFQRREGVLIWHCLSTLKNKEPLPVTVQRKLFHQAIGGEMWQAVKPLMVEEDVARTQHRDLAFLEAIELHLWDVVDHCQVLGADINVEDENGETPLHREARKNQWKAVEEIVLRDGNPNMLDKDGVSVLNRLIYCSQWKIAKTVIKYGANIHLSAKRHERDSVLFESYHQKLTPLQGVINYRQMDVLEMTLMWCSEQWRGVNDAGETAFHAACVSGSWHILPDLVARKVDPLAVTQAGRSALVYAVLSQEHPQRMVAEYCRLGFSAHQPALTPHHLQLADIVHDTYCMWRFDYYNQVDYLHNAVGASPLVCAVLRDLPIAVLMLYHSGACSHTELVNLFSQLSKLEDFDIGVWENTHLKTRRHFLRSPFLPPKLREVRQKYPSLLHKMAATPRSLLSSCRLLISRHLTLHKQRLWHVDRLRLPQTLRNYLKFSEFFEPDFGKDLLHGVDSLESQF